MGKGDNYRPTDQKKYNSRYDSIEWDEQKAPAKNDDQIEMPVDDMKPED